MTTKIKVAVCPRCKSEFPADVLENPEQLQELQDDMNKYRNLGCELCRGQMGKMVKFTANETRRVFGGDGFNEKFYNEKYNIKTRWY